MSTPARIGLKNDDGTVKTIEVNGDGYPSWTGQLLLDNYDLEKTKRLIELGDCSYLEREIDPPEGVEHTYDNPAGGVTVFYHRDREEDWEDVCPKTYGSEEEFRANMDNWGYGYLFKDGKWWYCKGHRDPVLLTKKLCDED